MKGRKAFEANFEALPLDGYRYITPHRYSGRMSRERIGVEHGFVSASAGWPALPASTCGRACRYCGMDGRRRAAWISTGTTP